MKGPYATLACYIPDVGRPGSLVVVAKTVTFQNGQLQPCAGANQARCAGVTCAPVAPHIQGGAWNPTSADYPPFTEHHRARTMFPLKYSPSRLVVIFFSVPSKPFAEYAPKGHLWGCWREQECDSRSRLPVSYSSYSGQVMMIEVITHL